MLACTAALGQPTATDNPTTGTLPRRTGTRFHDTFRDDPSRAAPDVIHVEAGTFLMGSNPTDPGFRATEVLHEVEVGAFSIGATEVTNAQFCEFLNERGNQLDDGIRWILTDRTETCLIYEDSGRFLPIAGAADRPVVTVSWNGARAYCRWLSEKTGASYRLPTEAEWERAARAGTSTTWPWGAEFNPSRLRWKGSPGPPGTVAVATTPPNPWGIHDMLGNTWEWVLDCFEDGYYSISPRKDPVHFDDDCWTPGIRGGSFRDGPEWCRPGFRVNLWWWGEFDGVGFRILREEGAPRFPVTGKPKRLKPKKQGPVTGDQGSGG